MSDPTNIKKKKKKFRTDDQKLTCRAAQVLDGDLPQLIPSTESKHRKKSLGELPEDQQQTEVVRFLHTATEGRRPEYMGTGNSLDNSQYSASLIKIFQFLSSMLETLPSTEIFLANLLE